MFDLIIVTPQGPAYQGQVEDVVLPGSEGRFGVLKGHEHFLAPLGVGEVEIHQADGAKYAAISGGFADVSGDQVVVLADTCELAEEIDVARAERARVRAERELERLRAAHAEKRDFRVWEAALARAISRIQIARRAR